MGNKATQNGLRIIKKTALAKIAIAALLLLAIALVATATFGIIKWLVDHNSVASIQDDLSQAVSIAPDQDNSSPDEEDATDSPNTRTGDYWDFINQPLLSVDFSALSTKNPDTAAWINVQSTNINYPVVQTTDNDYYLTHAFNKNRNSAGWVFADYRNDMHALDHNTIIYGHGRRDTTMFGTLKDTLTASWQSNKSNHTIQLVTPSANTIWQVFAVYKTAPESYYLTTNFADDTTHQEFLDTITARSTYNFAAPPNTDDKILTLSTCANNLAGDRIVLHAKLIRSQPATQN